MIKVKFKKLYPDVITPDYAHPGDAGLDLYSREDKKIEPGEKCFFPVGFALEFPAGYVAIVKDKGGLAYKYGLHSLGGVFDAGYRGEYSVTLVNLGNSSYKVAKGDKLAQLVILPVAVVQLEEIDQLSDSSRAGGRFGSTGK